MKRILSASVAAGVLAWLAMPFDGMARYWTGSASGLWSNPDNWDPAGVPTNGEDLIFYGSDATMNDLTNLVVNSLVFDGDDWITSGNTLIISHAHGDGVADYAINVNQLSGTDVHIRCGLKLGRDAIFLAGDTVNSGANTLYLEGPIDLNGHHLTLRAELYPTGNDSGGTGEIYVSGEISGYGNILAIAMPDCSLEFNGSGNSFDGILTLTAWPDGVIFLNASSGVIATNTVRVVGYTRTIFGTVAPSGPVRYQRPNQIGDHATVSIEGGGRIQLNGHNDAIANLSLVNNVADDLPSSLDMAGGTFTVNGSIRSTSGLGQLVIDGQLNLDGFIPITVDSRLNGLQINAQISGNGFNKLGPGPLRLAGANSFWGDVAVTEGTLEALSSAAFGQAGPTFGVHLNGGGVVLRSVAIGAEPLFVNSSASLLTAIGACSWAGPMMLNAELQVVALDPSLSGAAFNMSGSISGNSGLSLLAALFGVGNVRLSGSGANTFTGPLTVGCQRLELNKPSGVNAYGGPLIVGRPGATAIDEVRWLNHYQHVGATVTLYSNALVNLNNFNENFGPITFNGGQIETGNGQCAIDQPLTVNPSSATAFIEGNLGLPPGGPVRFNIGDGAAEFDLLVNATVFGSAPDLIKEGAGTMALTAANTYTGETHVNDGVLFISDGSALGSASARTFVHSNATLQLGVAGTITDSLEINGAGVGGRGALSIINGGSWTLNGVLLLDGASSIDVGSNASFIVTSGIVGTGSLTKAGAGSLTFGGTVNNSYSGDTIVSRGTLILNKPGGTTTVPHHLIIGTGAFNSPATVQHHSGFTIVGSITVDRGGLWDLNGQAEGFAVASLEGRPPLTLNYGGRVQTGAGIIFLPNSGDVVVTPGSIGSSTISGRIGLDPGTHHFRVGRKTNPLGGPECTISATISESSNPADLVKDGSGTLLLSATNAHRGATTVNAGTLRVDGVQPQSFAVINAGAQLQGTGTVGHIFINGAAVAAGNGAGTLTCSNFNAGVGGSGVLQIELSGTTPGSGYGRLNVRGAVNLSSMTLNASHHFASAVGNSFTIINNDGIDSVAGTFNGLPQNAKLYIGGELFQVTYTGGDGNDVALTRLVTPPRPVLTIQPVPAASARLLWATSDPPFRLQFNTNLTTTNWSAALPPPVVSGTNNAVTNVTSDAHRFYRLSNP